MSTRNILGRQVSRLFRNKPEEYDSSVPKTMKPTDSCSSFTSISSVGYRTDSLDIMPTQTMDFTTGQQVICDVESWVKQFEGKIEGLTVDLFKSGLDNKRRMLFSKPAGLDKVASLSMQILYVAATPSFGLELLPTSISDYRDDLAIVQIHQKVWKQGYLWQLGGDCDVSCC
jgi:hypothetical protein